MKRLKEIDFIIQVLLIVATLIFILTNVEFAKIILLFSLFIIGCYQLLSMLIHEYTGFFTKNNSIRRFYHNISYMIIAFALLSSFIPGILYIILYVTPVMALTYTYICYKETFVFLKRPLSILK